MISQILTTQTSDLLNQTYPFIQPKFLSIKQENLNQFFKNQTNTDHSCLQWMLLSLCNNDTDFFKKLRHELFHLLITEDSEGIRKVTQDNILKILEFGEFLKSSRDRKNFENQKVMVNYEYQ